MASYWLGKLPITVPQNMDRTRSGSHTLVMVDQSFWWPKEWTYEQIDDFYCQPVKVMGYSYFTGDS